MHLIQRIKRAHRDIFRKISFWSEIRRDLQRRLAIHAHCLNEAELANSDPWMTRPDIDPAVAL